MAGLRRPEAAGGAVRWRSLAIRFGTELGPSLAFALTLQLTGLFRATVVLVVGVAATTAFSWWRRRRVPLVPLGMLAVVSVLGGLTLAQGSAIFVQLLPTIANGAAAAALLVGLAFDRPLLKTALEDGFRLRDGAWRRLSLRMAVYLIAIACTNEIVRRSVSTEAWAWYKAAVPLLNAAFLASNWRLVRGNLIAPDNPAPDDQAEGTGEAGPSRIEAATTVRSC